MSPGLRIGWIVGPDPVIERLSDIKMQTDYESSSLSQYVVDKWLADGIYEDYLKQIREQLKFRRGFTIQILTEYFSELATWNIPKGGFYIWLRLQPNISIRKLFYAALQEGILINPGSIYDKNDQDHLRLSFSFASMEDLEKGLIRLSEMIKNL
ncbi:Aminotransferase class I and II [Lentibacillus halodurans]|uniref:Aminotransferase class I and II n=1 Tax=Lentibacillus halodurans TaxID=237679 RepID=A0A1I0ZTP2_9BACI|nr:Aminotransferase class I and II [Lentibacillus halodurans]